jgi:SAM-dependent methyltransferase
MSLPNVNLLRHPHTPPALRERELQWWARYGGIEERYSWGVVDSWQPPARLRYIGRMAEIFTDCSHVVDYGCGSGWLARMLAERLQRPVTGVDFSGEQIGLAAQRHADCPWTLFAPIDGPADLPRAPGYVFHGLLHHLSVAEIEALLDRVQTAAPRGARLVFVEPVCFPGNVPDIRDGVLLEAIDEVVKEPFREAQARGVVIVPAVQQARSEAETRWWGTAPYGPSPMEKPFERDELPRLLERWFDCKPQQLVQFLPASQALAGELALLRDCDEPLADAIAPGLMAQMDALERVVLRLPRQPDAGWYLQMIEARVR